MGQTAHTPFPQSHWGCAQDGRNRNHIDLQRWRLHLRSRIPQDLAPIGVRRFDHGQDNLKQLSQLFSAPRIPAVKARRGPAAPSIFSSKLRRNNKHLQAESDAAQPGASPRHGGLRPLRPSPSPETETVQRLIHKLPAQTNCRLYLQHYYILEMQSMQ